MSRQHEHYDLPSGQRINVFGNGDWEIWISPSPNTYQDSLCIGVGSDRREAVADAVATLESAVAVLVLQAKP